MAGRRGADNQWVDFFLGMSKGKSFYAVEAQQDTVDFALKYNYLVAGDDVAIMKSIGAGDGG